MRRIICISLLLCFLLTILFSLTSCGESDTGSGDGLVINVYNWGEYISDGSLDSYDTNAEFEAYYYETFGKRVSVNYTTYATNEDMYAKIKSGAGSYDIVIPSEYMIEKMIADDLLYAFGAETIPNYEYISDDFKNLFYDPENLYSVPYTYGKVGVIYNETMVDEEDLEDESWGLLWNEKYRGKILQFNNPRDGFGSAMYYANLDINASVNDEGGAEIWDEALSMLSDQKHLIQSYVSDEIFNKMISGSAAIAPYYAGDYITMVDSNENLGFYYPSEGTNVFVDAMCIPKSAKHKELAKEYINFMLSEEPAVANAIYIGYASPNTLVVENEDYVDEMGEEAMAILYGDGDVNENYDYDPFYHGFDQETQDYVNALWEELKTESSTELWVHITSGAIVAGLLGFAGYSAYIRKKRSRDYRYRDREAAKLKAQK